MSDRELMQEQLIAAANAGLGPSSATPDATAGPFTVRQVRFYRAQGLLDPPARWEGKSPLFGERHVRQLLAIRALQQAGWTLQQIGAWLARADHAALAAAAEGRLVDVAPPPTAPRRGEQRAATAHWKAPVMTALRESEPVAEASGSRLAPGTYLVIDAAVPGFDPERAAAALERAARRLRAGMGGNL